MAVDDILNGARAWRLWGYLGWHEVRQHYRRSIIGPLWITISTGIFIGSLGVLYTYLFHMDISDYLPFLAGGMIVWTLITGLINEGCKVFISSGAMIKQVHVPLSVHIYRVIWRNLIIFFHNIWIFVLVMVLFRHYPSWTWFLAVPGLALIALNGLWVGLFLGTLSARFRDIPTIVSNLVQISFFLTPVLWKPDMRADLVHFVNLNPFHHMLQLVRGPLLGEVPELHTWLAALGITLGGWSMAFALYRLRRGRIAYWV